MQKVLQLDERFPTGEPTLLAVGRWSGHRYFREKTAYDKAACSPAYDWLNAFQPEEGHTIILVNALGEYESYDENKNGDGFNTQPYGVGQRTPCGHPECNPSNDGWVSEPETLLHHYQSFERSGSIFKHHVNKDPSRSLGKIRKAMWNNHMKRVELILDIKNSLDQDLVQRIGDGEFPAVSMGCHVRHDVCTVCGHRAPTRAQYCEHARYQMRQVDRKTGKKNAVLNPSPRFFDISIVYKPADPTGWMLKKVAEVEVWSSSAALGEKVAAVEAKAAAVRKLSDIQKEISGDVTFADLGPEVALLRRYRKEVLPHVLSEIPVAGEADVSKMAEFGLNEVTSTLAAHGAFLSSAELVRVYVAKLGAIASPTFLDRLVAFQPIGMELVARYPSISEKLGGFVEIDPKHVRPQLAVALAPLLQKRATMGQWAAQKIFEPTGPLGGMAAGPGYLNAAREPAKTDMMTLTDPNSGRVYRTTRGAAMTAEGQDHKATLGAMALLAPLYYAGLGMAGMPRKGGLGALRGAAALGGAALTGRAASRLFDPYRNPTYHTDQGVPVSGGTEFVKSSALPEGAIGTQGLLHKAAFDYHERRMVPVPLSAAKVAWLVAGIERPSHDALVPPDVDLPALLAKIGALLST